MKQLNKETLEIIWKRVNELKEKYPMKEKKPIKIQSAKTILSSLIKDNHITGEEDKEVISSLLVCGAFQFGCFEKSKEKIVSWINAIVDMTKKKNLSYFKEGWRNLEKSGVFKRGKIYANFDGECDGIELSLLICVAEGYIERSVRGVA